MVEKFLNMNFVSHKEHKEHKAGWKTVRLGEVCDVRDGTHASPKPSTNGKILLTSKNIKNGVISFEKIYFVSYKDAEEINKRSRVDCWDVLISMIGTVGEVVVIKSQPDFVIKNVGLIKTNNNESLAKWIGYYLQSREGIARIRERLKGTTQQFLSLNDLRSLEIPLPPLETQKKIAAVLGALDDKIELNRKMNENLEAQAQALFKSWFVDFTPFGGKMPEGWKRCALANVCELITDGSHSSPKEVALGKHKIYSVKDMGEYGFCEDKAKSISEEDYQLLVRNGCVPKEGDIVVAKDGSYMKSIFVVGSDFEGALLSSIAIFRPNKSKITSAYLLYFLREDGTRNDVKLNYVSGTGVPRIVLKDFKRYQIVVPDMKTVREADKFLLALRNRIMANERESRKLAELRDTLLPKLMKGEIIV